MLYYQLVIFCRWQVARPCSTWCDCLVLGIPYC